MTAKAEMWRYVMDRAPALKKLIDNFGDTSLWDYASQFYTHRGSLSAERKNEFLSYVGEYIGEAYGEEMCDLVLESLTGNYCISTADHHGPLGHPFFFQSAILRGLCNPQRAIVNFCTSHVSLGNSSYPRGFVVHAENGPYHGLPFFPAKERMLPVFEHRAFEKKDVEKILSLSGNINQKITLWLKENALSEKILSQKTYSQQITLLNKILWESIFDGNMPTFISLDGEKIVNKILSCHLKKDTSILKNILTNISWQSDIEKYFDRISCCFDHERERGTYLFWHINNDGVRTALWRNEDKLESRDKKICLSMNEDDIGEALSAGRVIPSGLLMHTTLACYYGVTCFGGFAQGTYLPQIFDAYQKISQKTGELPAIQPDILCEDIILLRDEQGRIMTALDMFVSKESWNIEKLLQNAKNTTLSESIELMLPEIARCL